MNDKRLFIIQVYGTNGGQLCCAAYGDSEEEAEQAAKSHYGITDDNFEGFFEQAMNNRKDIARAELVFANGVSNLWEESW